MSNPLLGKRALVTGASKGIGLAIARAFAENGANVVICGRQQTSLNKATEELRKTAKGKVNGCVADVSRSADVARLFEFADGELGGLDILVNNAGVGIFRSAAEMTVEEWDQVIGINLSGAFYCTREALSRFERARGGRIINISSLAGKNPFAGGSAYNASKFGLNGLSEATMLDHRHDGVAVTYIMPGSVATHFSGEAGERGADWKIAPEDIAEIVLGVIRLPKRTLVSRIEVRPSRPQKD
jgi:NAD(P)-dependent dehydrogenase (short-subunit alcohol dehydrogenase family)